MKQNLYNILISILAGTIVGIFFSSHRNLSLGIIVGSTIFFVLVFSKMLLRYLKHRMLQSGHYPLNSIQNQQMRSGVIVFFLYILSTITVLVLLLFTSLREKVVDPPWVTISILEIFNSYIFFSIYLRVKQKEAIEESKFKIFLKKYKIPFSVISTVINICFLLLIFLDSRFIFVSISFAVLSYRTFNIFHNFRI